MKKLLFLSCFIILTSQASEKEWPSDDQIRKFPEVQKSAKKWLAKYCDLNVNGKKVDISKLSIKELQDLMPLSNLGINESKDKK